MKLSLEDERRQIKRLRSLSDPTIGLFCTHRYNNGDSIPTAAFERNKPVVWAVSVMCTSHSPNGVIFEIGTGPNGTTCWMDSTLSKIGFGAGNNNTTTGAQIVVDYTKYLDAGVFKIVAYTNPGKGEIKLWLDGRLVGLVRGSTPPFVAWAGLEDGLVGNYAGTINTRVPLNARVALTNAAIAGQLKVYAKQVVRQSAGKY